MSAERLEETRKILATMDSLVEELKEVARGDGVYSGEEQQLVKDISSNVEQYKQLLDSILEDDEVDEEEFATMREFEHKIVNLALSQALDDDTISEDEHRILRRFIRQASLLDSIDLDKP